MDEKKFCFLNLIKKISYEICDSTKLFMIFVVNKLIILDVVSPSESILSLPYFSKASLKLFGTFCQSI